MGGLSLHNIECKAEAVNIKTFIELAASPKFCQSSLFTAIFSHQILGENCSVDPGLPPFITKQMLSEIKSAREQGLQIIDMDSKAWYHHLLHIKVLKEHVQLNGEDEYAFRKCKAELERPDLEWEVLWKRAHMPGLSNHSRTFLFRFLHNILPTQERLVKTTRSVTSAECTCCTTGEIDNIRSHSFISCIHTKPTMIWLCNSLSLVDPLITLNDIIWLQFSAQNESEELAAV